MKQSRMGFWRSTGDHALMLNHGSKRNMTVFLFHISHIYFSARFSRIELLDIFPEVTVNVSNV